MKTSIKHNFFYVLISLSALQLVGCGSSKTGSKATTLPSTQTVTRSLAECNLISNSTLGMTGYLSSYYVSQTQSYRDDLARLFISKFPDGILTTDSRFMQVLPWRVNEVSGQKVYDRGGLGLIFFLKSTGQYLNSNAPINSLSKSSITRFITDYNLTVRGITINNFFSHMIIVVSGLTTSDDALTFAVYDTANTSTAIASADSLLPAFFANPYYYKQTHPQATLYDLHPLNGTADGLSEADYLAYTNVFCQGFL